MAGGDDLGKGCVTYLGNDNDMGRVTSVGVSSVMSPERQFSGSSSPYALVSPGIWSISHQGTCMRSRQCLLTVILGVVQALTVASVRIPWRDEIDGPR